MPDLQERFRAADRLDVDDVWPLVRDRLTGSDGLAPVRPLSAPRTPGPRWRRLATIAAALALTVSSFALLAPFMRDRAQPTIDPLWQPSSLRGWIVFSSGGDIVAVDPAADAKSRDSRLLFHPPEGAAWPLSWSPNGAGLLFSWSTPDDLSSPGGTADLYLLGADRTLTRLTTDGRPAIGSFAPDGTIIYGTTMVETGLFRLDPSTGARVRLELPVGGWQAWPAAAPDGSIAFIRGLDDGSTSIQLMASDGSHQRTLVDGLPRSKDSSGISWSPDGTRLAFGLLTYGNQEKVYVMNADGSGLYEVGDGAFPSWSPDGTRLVLDRLGELVTVGADGNGSMDLGIHLEGEGWGARLGPWNTTAT